MFLIPALRADAIDERNSAEGAAIHRFPRSIFLSRGIDSAGEGDFGNIELVFQELIYDLDHTFHRHGLLGNDQAGIGICSGKFCLESRTLHFVRRSAILDSLLLIDIENCRQKRIILTQNQSMIKILQHLPCGLLDFVAGENHVYAGFDGILDLKRQNPGMSVKILGFSLEFLEPVCILQFDFRDASHSLPPFSFLFCYLGGVFLFLIPFHFCTSNDSTDTIHV